MIPAHAPTELAPRNPETDGSPLGETSGETPVVRFPQRSATSLRAGSSGEAAGGPSEALVRRLREAATAGRRRTPAAAVRVLPAQDTSIMTVDLPVRDARTRRAAAPFALEERIAAPLERVHAVVGPRVGSAGSAYLVVVGDRVQLDELARAPGPILPEAFAIPRPPADPTGRPVWAAWRDGERVVVRADDGTGFAMRLDAFEPMWSALGRPRLLSYGEALPGGVETEDRSFDPPPPDPHEARLDLGQGLGAAGGVDPVAVVVRVAVLLLVAALGHVALLMADISALDAVAARERLGAQAAIAGPLPGLDVDLPPAAILARLSPSAAVPERGAFLPLMTRVSDALVAGGAEVTVRRLAFTAADGELRLLAQGAGLDALQNAERILREAGISVRSGIATSGQGGAEAELTIGDPQAVQSQVAR